MLLWGTLGVAVVGAARVYSGAHYPLDVLAALPVAWAGVMVGTAVANKVVPALAYGFSWQQAGVSLEAPHSRRAATRAAVPTEAHGSTARRVTGSSDTHDPRRSDRAA